MGARPNVKVYPAKRVSVNAVDESGWSVKTHMTADDMCIFARDLLQAAHTTGDGAARIIHDFGIAIVCLGWTPEGIKQHEHKGLALFREASAALFREHFEVKHVPQLGLLQEAAWQLLDAKTRREFIMRALSGDDGRTKGVYNENHPAFVRLLQQQTVAKGGRKRVRELDESDHEGGAASSA